MVSMAALPYALDLAGTFVFALSGAMAGIRHRADLFGVLVLSFAAANTGGITRDLLIGAVPPGAISDWHYLGVSLLAGIVTSGSPRASSGNGARFLFSTRPVSRCSPSPAPARRSRTD
jgi:uncharacterized membrane protein YeiH